MNRGVAWKEMTQNIFNAIAKKYIPHIRYKHSDVFSKYQLQNINDYFQKVDNGSTKALYRLRNIGGVKQYNKNQNQSRKLFEVNKKVDDIEGKIQDKSVKQPKKRILRPRKQKSKKKKQLSSSSEDLQQQKIEQLNKKQPIKTQTEGKSTKPTAPEVINLIEIKPKEEDTPANQQQSKTTNINVTQIYPHYSYSSMRYPFHSHGTVFPPISNSSAQDFPFHPIAIPPCFREVLEHCLSEMEGERQQVVEQYRNILYEIMNYIDKNYQKLNDTRTAGKSIVFSYCSSYNGQLVAPLIRQYTQKLKQQWKLSNKIISELCLSRITLWLKVNGYLSDAFKKQ